MISDVVHKADGQCGCVGLQTVEKVVNHDMTHCHSSPISPFAIEPIADWLEWRMIAKNKFQGDWLRPATFKSKASDTLLPTTPEEAEKKEMLNNTVIYDIVRAALDRIGFTGNICGLLRLCNTFARNQLYTNASADQLKTWLGLVCDHTINKLKWILPGKKAVPWFRVEAGQLVSFPKRQILVPTI